MPPLHPIPQWKIETIAPIALDSRDKKIISILQQNARTPVVNIAKFLKVSKAAVIYRIHQLTEKKIITGFKTHYRIPPPPNVTRIILLQHPLPNPHEKLAELAGYPGIITVMSLFGPDNVLVALTSKDHKDYEKFIELTKLINCKITSGNEITEIKLTPLDYTLEKININQINARSTMAFQEEFLRAKNEKIDMDALDSAIIQSLQNNARKTLLKIGEETGAYRPTIKKKISRLIRTGTIVKFSASVNPYAFMGTEFYVCLFNIKEDKEKQKLFDRIQKDWNGHGVAWVEGNWNMIAFLHFSSVEKLNDFEKYLSTQIKSLEKYQIQKIREQIKLEWMPIRMR